MLYKTGGSQYTWNIQIKIRLHQTVYVNHFQRENNNGKNIRHGEETTILDRLEMLPFLKEIKTDNGKWTHHLETQENEKLTIRKDNGYLNQIMLYIAGLERGTLI